MTESTLHFLNALAALDEMRSCHNEHYHYELDYYIECCMANMTRADRTAFKSAI